MDRAEEGGSSGGGGPSGGWTLVGGKHEMAGRLVLTASLADEEE